jgi:hypothetical protein
MFQSLKCCGYESIQDRAIPKSCSVFLKVSIGCKQAVIGNIQQWHQYITIAIILLLATQVTFLRKLID